MSTSVHQITDDELRKRHEDVPPDYYHTGVNLNRFQRMWHSRRIPIVHQFVSGRNGRLLDLGCHGGYLTAIIARESGATVTGIDISPEAIAHARKHVPGGAFVVGDLQDHFPFADQSFETATAFDVLEHIPRLDDVFSEIHRVLVTGGRLIVGVPRDTPLFRLVWNAWTKLRGAVWDDVHVHEFTPEALQAVALRHGFIVVRSQISHWGMYLTTEFEKRT